MLQKKQYQTVTHHRCFNSGMKLESFYELLVKDNLAHDSVDDAAEYMDDPADGQLENNKTVLEISHSFADGSRYYKSYLARTISKCGANV